MTKKELFLIYEAAAKMTDKQLEDKYYELVYDNLGSEAEIMEQRGYDELDIKERRKFEKYKSEECDIFEFLCEARGITLWDEDAWRAVNE